ncbi:aminotransferase class I/II-fold pyridoxal phosphate-dependent enzyme [Proteobacteria bacterium 005FR1]|nr:aminotransferase class I/II-fold pyridoxal phosphate-dependent enzyme [Proteobacteria bacterium 005FR1]
MYLDTASAEQCKQWESNLAEAYQALQARGLNLDITRGKPSSEQLSLSDALDGILNNNYRAADGTDTRNYGGLDGLPEARQLGSLLMDVPAEAVLVGGNSSLTLMFQAALVAYYFGYAGAESAWQNHGTVKFICPVPGYDRHFTVTETFGIEMVTVPMTATGPDMDAVESLVKSDPAIRGMWNVPRFSNPTGVVYSDETVKRIAALGKVAHPSFRVFWDNAYAVHQLTDDAPALANIYDYCRELGTEDSVLQFASTSKITHAGAGVAFMAASPKNLAAFKKMLSASTIGPDKENQLRHCKFIPDGAALKALMDKHAALLKPRFETVLSKLEEAFADSDLGSWEKPQGGYFVSFDARPGCAHEIVRLAAEAGVKLTPAGATFPYGKDPENRNIRIAPSVPTVNEIATAMDVFVVCVKLASVRKKLGK